MSTSSRKMDHIRICLEKMVEGKGRPFEDLELIHRALPEIDEDDIDTSCTLFGSRLNAPIIISAMTGGHQEAKQINVRLAQAAQDLGIALGVGSQRAALEDSKQIETFSAVRKVAPDIPIVGNIGAIQLKRSGPEILEQLADMIDADAIAIHLNFLQESIQPEGERDGFGILSAIKSAAKGSIPLIVKETGSGISREVASDLVQSGVKIIDVSGRGGMSWAGVEAYRAAEMGDKELEELGKLFWNWGIPTPVSIMECKRVGAEVIASGGIRNGLDIAKSIALGAAAAGTALPMLVPASKSDSEVIKAMKVFIRALRISMFLTGCKNLKDLSSTPLVITGTTKEWMEARDLI